MEYGNNDKNNATKQAGCLYVARPTYSSHAAESNIQSNIIFPVQWSPIWCADCNAMRSTMIILWHKNMYWKQWRTAWPPN